VVSHREEMNYSRTDESPPARFHVFSKRSVTLTDGGKFFFFFQCSWPGSIDGTDIVLTS